MHLMSLKVIQQARQSKPQINQDAVRLMKQHYGIDMEASQHSKLIEEIPNVDIAVKMGCNVVCPYIPSLKEEDWGLDDPSGKGDDEFMKVILVIDQIIKEHIERVSESN